MTNREPKLYKTLWYDAPWPRQGGEAFYETMPLSEIRAFVIKTAEMAAPDAHCYFWTTNRYLRESYDILEAAGWTVRSPLTWVKFRLGLGGPLSLRNATEHVLFATRGKLPLGNRSTPTWVNAPVTTHSTKPGVFFEVAELLSPAPRVEFFARVKRHGWDCWGDELSPSIPPIEGFPVGGDYTDFEGDD